MTPPPRPPTTSPDPTPDPTTSPDPTPSPSASPAGSAGSSRASRSASAGRFDVDPGPAFDADGRPEGEEPPAGSLHELPAPLELWDERRVRQLLTAKGMALHYVLAVDRASGEWVYTERDLEAIAPPLTAILNRYDATRAAAGAGDELALAVGFGGYAARSIRERRAAVAARDEQAPEPVTGVHAEPGTGPEDDVDWQRQHGYLELDDDDVPPIHRRR